MRDIDGGDRASGGTGVSHVVDYGSGQAYLGRTVAKKYGHNVVGIESRTVNIAGAKRLDQSFDRVAERKLKHQLKKKDDLTMPITPGSTQYVQTFISDGNIDAVVDAIPDAEQPKSLLFTSLHSCGNLVHHALSAFNNTPSVRAVALVGCCYNLLTEKRGATYKPPYLRTPNARLMATSTAGDPQGFPISASLTERNVQLNITARAMACQAPQNWTRESSADFFLRHFYRALLQHHASLSSRGTDICWPCRCRVLGADSFASAAASATPRSMLPRRCCYSASLPPANLGATGHLAAELLTVVWQRAQLGRLAEPPPSLAMHCRCRAAAGQHHLRLLPCTSPRPAIHPSK